MRRLPDGVRMVLIAGPTASGKSSLALRLAERIGGEIVNADALQLYGDLRLLTARPDTAEEARAPHHLFGVADAADGWSAGRWLRAAGAVLDEIAARGRPAIVVGGTGLYFQALTQGIAAIPPIPAQAREAAVARLAALGEAAFRAELAAFDPRAEARIAPGDHRRLTRAYEVHAVSGQALSDLQAAAAHGAQPPGAWTAVALEPPREALYRRGEARLARMVAEGVLGEVARLAARGLDPELPAMKAVGMREFAAHLRGETSLDEALTAAQRATRNYAKRQITWRRGRMADWPRLTAADPQDQWGQFLALHRALTP